MKIKIIRTVTLILMIMSYVMVGVCSMVSVPQRGTLTFGTNTDEPLMVISDKTVIFDIPKEVKLSEVYGIKLRLATYGADIEEGELYIDVIDKNTEKILLNTKIDLAGTCDGSERTAEFYNICNNTNDAYVRISAGQENEQPIALWLDEYKDAEVLYDGENVKGAVYCSLLYYSNGHVYIYEFIIISLILTAFWVLLGFDKRKNDNVKTT